MQLNCLIESLFIYVKSIKIKLYIFKMHNVYNYFQKDSLLQNTLRMRARTALHLPTHRKSFAATSSHCGTDERKKCFSWVVLTLSSLDSNSHTSPSTSSMVALWGEESQRFKDGHLLKLHQ